jgi:hypothetical protein
MTPQQKVEMFVHQIDSTTPDQRPPDWETTKSLIRRPAPRVGEVAPDFSLETLDHASTLTRSTFQAGKHLVLVFGSFT